MAQAPTSTNRDLFCKETASNIFLTWGKPPNSFEYFEIKYRDTGKESKFNVNNVKQTVENRLTLYNLKGDTDYEIKGFIIQDGDHNKLFHTFVKTKKSLIPDLIKLSDKVWENPLIYKLRCSIYEVDEGLRDCHISKYEIF